MDNQHKLIEGYRDLSAEEIALMNEAKVLGAQVGAFIDRMKANPDVDHRWISIGQTHLQQGIMALVRAVAKPGGF